MTRQYDCIGVEPAADTDWARRFRTAQFPVQMHEEPANASQVWSTTTPRLGGFVSFSPIFPTQVFCETSCPTAAVLLSLPCKLLSLITLVGQTWPYSQASQLNSRTQPSSCGVLRLASLPSLRGTAEEAPVVYLPIFVGLQGLSYHVCYADLHNAINQL